MRAVVTRDTPRLRGAGVGGWGDLQIFVYCITILRYHHVHMCYCLTIEVPILCIIAITTVLDSSIARLPLVRYGWMTILGQNKTMTLLFCYIAPMLFGFFAS